MSQATMMLLGGAEPSVKYRSCLKTHVNLNASALEGAVFVLALASADKVNDALGPEFFSVDLGVFLGRRVHDDELQAAS